MLEQIVEIPTEEYIKFRNQINHLQSENRRLQTIIDAITVVFRNSGIVK